MAALTAALLGLAGASAYSAIKGSRTPTPELPAPVAPPPAPVPDPALTDAAARTAAKLAGARTQRAGQRATLLTGPSGLTTPATVGVKTLLGQ